ncbi:MAG: Gfo/Idh/MocA family oxidoreductase [Clostridia bacterium]|nr:Gfo/Idh/MocA family oxidoreductase [Clostridia bacterium]
MKEIGIAIIGWGFMGRTHTHSLRAIPLMYPGIGFRPVLKCVCSRREAPAKEAMENMGFERYTTDWRDILEMDDVDAVSICTPNDQHEEMAIAFLQAGKHVYIDKPLTVTYESAKRIEEAAANSASKTQMVMNNRFLPATMRAKQLAEEGALGEIISIQARYLHSGSIDENKPIGWKQTEQGGVILDLMSHALDLVMMIAGEPKSVICMTNSLYSDRPTQDGGRTSRLSEDHAIMTLRMPNGAIGTVEASKIATGTNDELSFEIYGKKGAIRFDLMEPGWLWFFDNTIPEAPLGGRRGFTRIECMGRYEAPAGKFLPPKNAVGWDRGHIHSYYCFLKSIYEDTLPSPDIHDGARLQYVLEKAAESARTGLIANISE